MTGRPILRAAFALLLASPLLAPAAARAGDPPALTALEFASRQEARREHLLEVVRGFGLGPIVAIASDIDASPRERRLAADAIEAAGSDGRRAVVEALAARPGGWFADLIPLLERDFDPAAQATLASALPALEPAARLVTLDLLGRAGGSASLAAIGDLALDASAEEDDRLPEAIGGAFAAIAGRTFRPSEAVAALAFRIRVERLPRGRGLAALTRALLAAPDVGLGPLLRIAHAVEVEAVPGDGPAALEDQADRLDLVCEALATVASPEAIATVLGAIEREADPGRAARRVRCLRVARGAAESAELVDWLLARSEARPDERATCLAVLEAVTGRYYGGNETAWDDHAADIFERSPTVPITGYRPRGSRAAAASSDVPAAPGIAAANLPPSTRPGPAAARAAPVEWAPPATVARAGTAGLTASPLLLLAIGLAVAAATLLVVERAWGSQAAVAPPLRTPRPAPAAQPVEVEAEEEVYVPVPRRIDPPPLRPSPMPEARPRVRCGGRLLVASARPELVTAARDAGLAGGYRVVVRGTVADALAEAKWTIPDAALIDLGDRDASIKVARGIRDLPHASGMPIALVLETGGVDSADVGFAPTLHLRAAPAPAAVGGILRDLVALRAPGRRILFVGPPTQASAEAVQQLRFAGFMLTTALPTADIMEAAVDVQPDALVIDVALRLVLRETLESIRAVPAWASLPVVGFSAIGRGDVVDAAERGINALAPPAQLATVIDRLLMAA